MSEQTFKVFVYILTPKAPHISCINDGNTGRQTHCPCRCALISALLSSHIQAVPDQAHPRRLHASVPYQVAPISLCTCRSYTPQLLVVLKDSNCCPTPSRHLKLCDSLRSRVALCQSILSKATTCVDTLVRQRVFSIIGACFVTCRNELKAASCMVKSYCHRTDRISQRMIAPSHSDHVGSIWLRYWRKACAIGVTGCRTVFGQRWQADSACKQDK